MATSHEAVVCMHLTNTENAILRPLLFLISSLSPLPLPLLLLSPSHKGSELLCTHTTPTAHIIKLYLSYDVPVIWLSQGPQQFNSPAVLRCVYKGPASYQSLATGNLSLGVALKLSCVPILQTMPERSGKLLLIILCLLPCSVTSFECSLNTEENFFTLVFSSCFYQYTSNQFPNGSARCSFTCTPWSLVSALGLGWGSLDASSIWGKHGVQ